MKTKKKSKNKEKINEQICGIIISSLSILAIISLFSNKTGSIGKIMKNVLLQLLGVGGYVFPIITLILGIFFIMKKIIKEEKKLYSLLIIFLCFLTIIDIKTSPKNMEFLDKISKSIALGLEGKGSGIVGSFLGFVFYKLFGSIGSYIIMCSIVIICIMIISDYKIYNIVEISKKEKNVVKGKSAYNHDENNLYNKSNKINKNAKRQNNLKILDYTQNTDNNKKISDEKAKITRHDFTSYELPSLSLLKDADVSIEKDEKKNILENAKKIEDTMKNFGIQANIIQISKGPTITCYELQPAPGVKVSKIVNLSDDIALTLATSGIRIEAPIPGKSAVGIEVPNKNKIIVSLKELLNSYEFQSIDKGIPIALGKDISGSPIIGDIEKMPHLLIAGATGSGKSVCINTIIMSILYKLSPSDVQLLLIDPKMVELNIYSKVPHLIAPVVTDAKKASNVLNWAVDEMNKRYKLFAKNNVRDINSYNSKVSKKDSKEKLSKIVIIIDELADLMMVSAQEVEDCICRIAQMARAAGMYLIIATQRPSVDVITGTIKANIPSRISFAVTSQTDSRTILDMNGAEKLLGKGDMLYFPSGAMKPTRIQGAYVDEAEIQNVVDFLGKQNMSYYDENLVEAIENDNIKPSIETDELIDEAIKLVVEEGQASISLLQRKLKIGYSRAARIVDQMEEMGIVGGYEGSKPRKVLITKESINNQGGT